MGIVRYSILLIFFAIMITYSRVLMWASVHYGLRGIFLAALIVIGLGVLVIHACRDRGSA
jgi:hypothetical protein